MKLIIKNQNGFTLIELLIALVIFAVGILGLATMQTTSIQGNSKSRQISEASNIAADRIEQILSMPYMPNNSDSNGIDDDGDGLVDAADPKELQYIDVNGNGSTGLNVFPGSDVGPVAVGNYRVYWNIAVDYPVPDTKTIRIFVDPPGNGPNVMMEVVKAKPI